MFSPTDLTEVMEIPPCLISLVNGAQLTFSRRITGGVFLVCRSLLMATRMETAMLLAVVGVAVSACLDVAGVGEELYWYLEDIGDGIDLHGGGCGDPAALALVPYSGSFPLDWFKLFLGIGEGGRVGAGQKLD